MLTRGFSICLPALALAASLSCGGPGKASVEDLASGPLDLQMETLTGARDGGRLDAVVQFSGPAGRLSLDLDFQLGVPTTLIQGTYRAEIGGKLEEGSVLARSVTFLGGQSDRPNLGGTFTLLSAGGAERYRVRLPTSVVERPQKNR